MLVLLVACGPAAALGVTPSVDASRVRSCGDLIKDNVGPFTIRSHGVRCKTARRIAQFVSHTRYGTCTYRGFVYRFKQVANELGSRRWTNGAKLVYWSVGQG